MFFSTYISGKTFRSFLMLLFYFSSILFWNSAIIAQETGDFLQYKGYVVDSKTRKPLEFATVSVKGTNISTVTNTEGEFSLKVPPAYKDNDITISYLGYYNKVVSLNSFSDKKNVFKLDESVVTLPEINVTVKDPNDLVRKMLARRGTNYLSEPSVMTAFYRESIRKGKKKYASLSEAVVEIYKASYKSDNQDYVRLYKARKSTDYRRLDTLMIKLQGGPYNALNFDIVKNKGLIFDENVFNTYKFSYENTMLVDNRATYVVSFKQYSNIEEPLYYGKLYIDTATFALTKAVVSLNLDDKDMAAKYFVKKKPTGAKVWPFRANYYVDYRSKNGKWFYNYSRIELGFKIKYDKKLFNANYYITVEMAVTDWDYNTEGKSLKHKERLRRNVILNDKVSGFSDPEFWGDYNVIEPEKSIENAIKKIKRQLEKKS